MVQKVRHQPNLIQDNSRTMMNPSIPQNETLIEVQDVSDFPAIPNSTMRNQPRGNTNFQGTNETISRKSPPPAARPPPPPTTNSIKPNLQHQFSMSPNATASFGGSELAIANDPRPRAPNPTDLLSPPVPNLSSQGTNYTPNSRSSIPRQTQPLPTYQHPNKASSSQVNPTHQNKPPSNLRPSPTPPTPNPTTRTGHLTPDNPNTVPPEESRRGERFLLRRRDGDSLERLEQDPPRNSQDELDDAEFVVSRGDYEKELAQRAKRAKERLEAAELKKAEQRKQNMLGMFKDFREEVQNILSSYRDMDVEKIESSQRDSIKRTLQSSMNNLQAKIHQRPQLRSMDDDPSEEEDAGLSRKHKQQPHYSNQRRSVDDEPESEVDETERRAAAALASKRQRLVELREKKKQEIKSALGGSTTSKHRLKNQFARASSSSESEEEVQEYKHRPAPTAAHPTPVNHSSLAAKNLALKVAKEKGSGSIEERGQLQTAPPKSYLDTSGEEDDDLKYTNTKQSSVGMEGTFGAPFLSKAGVSSKNTSEGFQHQKPKIRLVSEHQTRPNDAKIYLKETISPAPSIGEQSLDEMTEEQLLMVKEMIEQRIASSETRHGGKRAKQSADTRKNTRFDGDSHQDYQGASNARSPPQDVTIDDDFYDENFISLVYELNTGAV